MSKIRVWSSVGNWSGEINGLDKEDFIKSLILNEYDPEYGELNGLELDGNILSGSDFETTQYGEINDLSWYKFEKIRPLSKTRSLKARLSTMKKMLAHPYLAAAYNEIIKAACVPASAPADYCLLLRFY